jgi:hypothetical protein
MKHLLRHPPRPGLLNIRQGRGRGFSKLLLAPLAGFVLALTSCSGGSPEPPPLPVTDTQPVGEGLKVIGYAMLGAAVVVVLGRMIR